MADHLVSEIFRILLFESEPVVFGIFVPVRKFNHQVDILCFLDGRYTEQCLNIYDSDTAEFD